MTGSLKKLETDDNERAWYTYDTRGRVTEVSHREGPLTAEVETRKIAYTYDYTGNVTSRVNSGPGLPTLTDAFTYDWANRLKSEVRTGLSSLNFNNVYSYDKSGNRTSVVRNGTTYSYGTADGNNRLASAENGTYSFTYDNDGNPTTLTLNGVSGTATYDEASRMRSITLGGVTTTYRYDGDGRRVERTTGANTTRYVYDGDAVIAETNSSNTITTYQLTGIGYVTGTTQYYYENDAQGSALAVRDGSGNRVSRTEYDAFGVPYVAMAGPRSDYRFAGKHGYTSDDATGLQMLGARYYIPKLGRFLTQDPIGHEGGNNLYDYCLNNPLIRVDPDGKDLLDDAANFFGGWGHSLTAGATGAIAQAINRSLGYGEFEYGGGCFFAGQVVGEIHWVAMGRAGGLRALRAGAGVKTATVTKTVVIQSWKGAEAALAAEVGGKSQAFLRTNGGIARYIDQLADGIAHEAKYGFVGMSPRVRRQIAVDAALKAEDKIQGAVWHFYRSAQTGRIGAAQSVLDALRDAGIRVVFH